MISSFCQKSSSPAPSALRPAILFSSFGAKTLQLGLLFLALSASGQQMGSAPQPQGPPPLPHPAIPVPAQPPVHLSALLILGGIVLVGLIVTGLILLLYGGKKRLSNAPKRPIRDAIRALKDLRNRADVLPPSEVGHQVSEIMRRFYEVRYGIPAPFRTSQELFPAIDPKQEPLRRRMWRERYEPLAAIYDELSYAPVPATSVEALRLIDEAVAKLEDERLNEDPRAV